MPLRRTPLPRHDAGAEALSPGTVSTATLSPVHAQDGGRAAAPAMTAREPLAWPLAALSASLSGLRPGITVEVLAEADSSNTRLLERARGGDMAPRLLVVEHQTAGRGRQGRPWFAEAGPAEGPPGPGTLCFSLGLVLAPQDWSGLSLAVGVALAEALGPGVMLKWPNDLWLDADGAEDDGLPGGKAAGLRAPGRKLGGILIETLPVPPGSDEAALEVGPRRYAVLGVGLNLVPPVPREGLNGAVAGWRERQPQATAAGLLERVARPLLAALGDFERDGFKAFQARYAARDGLRGRPVQAHGAVPLSGISAGVDATGGLQLQKPEGLVMVVSGEVSIRPC